jgi:hypothetical protein
MLRYLRERGCPWDYRSFNAAVLNKQSVPVLQWLRAQGCPWDASSFILEAAATGNLEALQWGHSQGAPLERRVLSVVPLWHREMRDWVTKVVSTP